MLTIRWILSVGLVACLLASCAPLSEEAMNKMAGTSPSISQLSASLAKADKGAIKRLDGDRFLVLLDNNLMDRQQFLQVMSRHCASAYGGEIVKADSSFPLASKSITSKQVEDIAGHGGAVVGYLRHALARTLNSEVSRTARQLRVDASQKLGEKLYQQASIVCRSYGNDGLLKLHYGLDYLTRDARGKGDPVWAVAKTSNYAAEIGHQLTLAQTSANRAMWEDRDTVEQYVGEASGTAVSVKAVLSRRGDFGYDFVMALHVKNHGVAPLDVSTQPDSLVTGDGKHWKAKYQGPLYDRKTSCHDISNGEIHVAPGSQCQIQLLMHIEDFDMPDMMLTADMGPVNLDLSPVTRFQLEQKAKAPSSD